MASTNTIPTLRDEFVNDSAGIAGAIVIDGRGDRRGIAVPPGGSVWLSEEEQIETANAPRADADNPLVNGTFTLRTRGSEKKNRRPLAPEADPEVEVEVIVPEETGAAPVPVGEPEVGSRLPEEEVATPEAVPANARARRRGPASTT